MSQKSSSIRKFRELSWPEIGGVAKETFVEFFKENGLFHGAALSYYTIFALVPIIYLSIISFGQIIGQETMIEIITKLLKEQVGIRDVSGIIDFLKTFDFEKGNFILNIVGIIALVISSTALFASLKHSINEFLDIHPQEYESKKKKFLANLFSRLISVALLGFFGLLVVVAYFAQTVLISFGNKLFENANTIHWLVLVFAQHGIALFSNVVIFLFVFKYLHDGNVPWKLAWAGSLVTATMLYLGQLVIKYYLLNYFFVKEGGVAGTLLVILAWMYYSSQIIFFGAKFTAVYGKKVGYTIHER
jgi:membrane protein